MKKRLLLLSLSAIMAVSCLSGCGTQKTSKSGVTEVVIWTGDSHSKVVMNKLVNEFNNGEGKKNGVKIKYEVKEEDSAQSLDIALQNGKGPDLYPAAKMQEYSEKGYAMALDDIPELGDFLKNNSDIHVEGWNVYKDKTYFVPTSSQLFGLAINKDLFKKAGIVDENGDAKAPETLEEMIEDAKKLTDDSKQQYGMIFPVKWSGFFGCEIQNTAPSSGGGTGYDFAKGEFDFNQLKPMMEAVMQIKKDGGAYPGAEGLDNDPARARFAEGNVGMKFSVSWDVGVWNDQFPAKCDWDIYPIPVADKDESYYQLKNPSWSMMINKKSVEEKGSDKIALVYNWLYSDEMAAELYKQGVQLPWKYDIVKNTKLTDAKKGWESYAKLLEIASAYKSSSRVDISAYEPIGTAFVNEVWSGKKSIDTFIKEQNAHYNDGIKKYVSANEGYEPPVDKEYNMLRSGK